MPVVYFDYQSADCYLAWRRLGDRVEWRPLAQPGGRSETAALCHLEAAGSGREKAWMEAALRAQWVEGRPLDRPEVLDQLARSLGMSDLVERAKAGRVHDLEANRFEANLLGVQRLPCAVASGQPPAHGLGAILALTNPAGR